MISKMEDSRTFLIFISIYTVQVVVHATDGSPEPSPFLAGTLDATQDSKKNPSLQGDDEQIYLESLYRSMLKQQEWLSVEIKRIQKVCSSASLLL